MRGSPMTGTPSKDEMSFFNEVKPTDIPDSEVEEGQTSVV